MFNDEDIHLEDVTDDGEFTDPVLRCDSCQCLVRRETLHKLGSCRECGNKRMRNLTVFNDKEKSQLIEWGFEDFVNQFEETPDE